MARVTPKDLKAGVTIYKAYAFPHQASDGFIEVKHVTGRPFMNKRVGSEFAPYSSFLMNGNVYRDTFSLHDAGILPNTYNFHKSFLSRKAAERYLRRIDSGCLTAAERSRADEFKARDIELEWMGSIWYDDDI